jgi:hypothetical protein
VRAAEGSKKSAIENHQYIFAAGKISKRYTLAIKIVQGKIWRRGI